MGAMPFSVPSFFREAYLHPIGWADILMAKEGFHDVEEKNTEDGHSDLLTVRGRQRGTGK